ncbi:uncharacterized protein C8R40DRAFT_1099736 [Lentinula edodes]|uniref:uncharacterized protein n=1 Tax=Lentinula edodes TaxID=5353 RepID=UPI001E8CB4B7|nr:uncharacterized protein C8R40DRAFT_1099736 [Lentinula edodes]KAH7876409.1 hypothetical protein C8R40DRAFT_1099736 [Lentinula edodes]
MFPNGSDSGSAFLLFGVVSAFNLRILAIIAYITRSCCTVTANFFFFAKITGPLSTALSVTARVWIHRRG